MTKTFILIVVYRFVNTGLTVVIPCAELDTDQLFSPPQADWSLGFIWNLIFDAWNLTNAHPDIK